jgi:hypothetical protein
MFFTLYPVTLANHLFTGVRYNKDGKKVNPNQAGAKVAQA